MYADFATELTHVDPIWNVTNYRVRRTRSPYPLDQSSANLIAMLADMVSNRRLTCSRTDVRAA
jgi:hypothetical protein